MSNHGGKREGAGRPALDAEKMKNVSIRMPRWMADQLAEIEGDRSFLVRMACVDYYELKPPPVVKKTL